jgi:hypothetical protein
MPIAGPDCCHHRHRNGLEHRLQRALLVLRLRNHLISTPYWTFILFCSSLDPGNDFAVLYSDPHQPERIDGVGGYTSSMRD